MTLRLPASTPARDPQRPADVAGPDRAGQAVLGVVGQPDRVGLVVERQHRHDRAEDLLAPVPVLRRPRASSTVGGYQKPGPSGRGAAEGDVGAVHVGRAPRRAGAAEISGPISARLQRRVLHPQRAHRRLEQLQEPVVHRRAGPGSGTGRSSPGRRCRRPTYGRGGGRLLQVGVGEDDVGALAAQLQGHPLHLLGAAAP